MLVNFSGDTEEYHNSYQLGQQVSFSDRGFQV